jgi:hypothetical protein
MLVTNRGVHRRQTARLSQIIAPVQGTRIRPDPVIPTSDALLQRPLFFCVQRGEIPAAKLAAAKLDKLPAMVPKGHRSGDTSLSLGMTAVRIFQKRIPYHYRAVTGKLRGIGG